MAIFMIVIWLCSLMVVSYGEQGWLSGESTRLPPMWQGLDSRTQHHMWVQFVVGTLLREVFLWVLRFSPLLKNQHLQIPI